MASTWRLRKTTNNNYIVISKQNYGQLEYRIIFDLRPFIIFIKLASHDIHTFT